MNMNDRQLEIEGLDKITAEPEKNIFSSSPAAVFLPTLSVAGR